jgi:CRP-like cAMP-binding protein
VYDNSGELIAKSGLVDFRDWYRKSFGKHSPWGDEDSPALVTAVETALERAFSEKIMKGGKKPRLKKVKAGDTLVQENEKGSDLFLVLDGVLRAEKGGERLEEYGPGALLGERAALEGGVRTATLVAVTKCRVAVASPEEIDRDALVELSGRHRREEN